MDRRRVMQWSLFALAFAAVFVALAVFKVRVAVAGGRYVLVLLAIVALVWLLSRALKR